MRRFTGLRLAGSALFVALTVVLSCGETTSASEPVTLDNVCDVLPKGTARRTARAARRLDTVRPRGLRESVSRVVPRRCCRHRTPQGGLPSRSEALARQRLLRHDVQSPALC